MRPTFHRDSLLRCCQTGLLVWLMVLWSCCTCFGQSLKEARASEAAGLLDTLKEKIAQEINGRLQSAQFSSSYTTVWRQFEDAAIEALVEVLPKQFPQLTESQFDRGTSGREKNRVADLAMRCSDGQIEISVKSARRSANPENDLGTFRDHPNRKNLFAASFTLWVRYEDSGKEIKCDRVFFDRSWRFVGRSTLVDGVKYRKKDGNMRPKPWAMFDSGESYWKSEEDVEDAVKRAELFRANELIKEYLDDLSESDQKLLYERLCEKFGSQTERN